MRVLGRYLNSLTEVEKLRDLCRRAASERVERTPVEPTPPTTHLRKVKKLRERDIDTLVARYHETRNIRQVAREFELSRTTVAKHLGERGVDTSNRMKPGDVDRAVVMYSEGLSSMVIGERLGFDNRTILRELRERGVEIRKPLGRD